jgi:hypothetical protein
VPLTVTVAGAVLAVAEAVKVTVLVAPVAEAGLKLALTPAGRPLADSATAPVKPPLRAMLIVLVAVPPCGTTTLEGLAASVKFGVGGVPGVGKSCVCGMICFSMPSGVLQDSVATASPPFS